MIPEHRPQDAGIARRSRQWAVIAIILIQTCRQQRSDVETGNLHSLICQFENKTEQICNWWRVSDLKPIKKKCVKWLCIIKVARFVLTSDSPLYLMPLMNFRNCSKAGLNSPTCMKNTVRSFLCSPEIHTSLVPIVHHASPQSGLPARPGRQTCPQPWTCWDTCPSCSALHASVGEKKMSQDPYEQTITQSMLLQVVKTSSW